MDLDSTLLVKGKNHRCMMLHPLTQWVSLEEHNPIFRGWVPMHFLGVKQWSLAQEANQKTNYCNSLYRRLLNQFSLSQETNFPAPTGASMTTSHIVPSTLASPCSFTMAHQAF